MAFEIELAFEGVVDRLDQLADGAQEPATGRDGSLASAGRGSRTPRAANTASVWASR
jgi:hypothetical protein